MHINYICAVLHSLPKHPHVLSTNLVWLKLLFQESVQERSSRRKDEIECQTSGKNTNVYISFSPRIFRKNIYHTNKLQREIIVNSKDNSKPIEFDPSVDRKPPLYLDIPNLYKRKRQELIKKVNLCLCLCVFLCLWNAHLIFELLQLI